MSDCVGVANVRRACWAGALGLALLVGCGKKPAPSGAQAQPAGPSGTTAAAPSPAPAAAPAPPSAGPTGSDPCPLICERARALKCKQSERECVAGCRQMRDGDICRPEVGAVLRCFAREPIAHWECNDQGEPAVKDGYCDAEQGGLVACAQKTMGATPTRPRSL